jgi:uncharacterized membrane protein YcgQ (UPF0703/DUF1980 family)
MVIIDANGGNGWTRKRIKNLIILSFFYYMFYIIYLLMIGNIFHPYYWITIVVSLPGAYILFQWSFLALVLNSKR